MAYTTRAKNLALVTLVQGEEQTPIFVSPTFTGAFRVSCFEQAISKPNLTERQARAELNRSGVVEIWNGDLYPYREAALWEAGAKLLRIQLVPIKKHT